MRFRFTADVRFEADTLEKAEERLHSYFELVLAQAEDKKQPRQHLAPAVRPLASALATHPESFVRLDCEDTSLPPTSDSEVLEAERAERDRVQSILRERYAPDFVAREHERARLVAEYAHHFGAEPPAAIVKQADPELVARYAASLRGEGE